MKKLPIVLLALLMVISLFSCAEPEVETPKEYTVSFEGEGIISLPESFKVTEGNTFKLPNNLPKQEGHKLIVKNGTEEIKPDTEYEISSDITLTCSWERTHYKVSFTGADPLPAAFNVEVGKKYKLTGLPEKENHKFVVKNGELEIKPDTEYEISSDITLTCSWERTHYKVSFTGADPLPAAFNVEVGKKYKLTGLPEKENHKLVVKNDEQEIKPDTEYEISSDITLTCSWERTHYKVSFTGITRNSENVSVSTKTFKIPYIEGYYIESIKLGDEEKKPGTDITVDKDITLAYKVQKGSDDLNIVEGVVQAKTSGKYTGPIVIPDMTADGKLVTGIEAWAFGECLNMTSITIPNSVTSIKASAFNSCYNLTSVRIPDSVVSIGKGAFTDCVKIQSIVLSDNIKSIPDSVFSSCKELKSITIPDNVNSIGQFSFVGCSALTSISIPSNVTSIGSHAFDSCENLTSITIPASMQTIEGYAFSACTKLTTINVCKTENECKDWGTDWHGATAEHQVNVKYTDKKVVYPTTP